ncbi:hypothetical protein [Anaerolactibacter massiliensis]|uniref:hypothetical protein n=1 Tax=Anaerolactibacter massiliensis TaxID=2044573 RepID=UPI000CF98E7F|nr:hypothetical protein [Anaerolactibacter massiliensis]
MRIRNLVIGFMTAFSMYIMPVLAEGETTGTQTLGGNTTAAFTNTLEGSVPTGVNMGHTGALVIAFITVGMAVVLLSRRK